MKFIKLEGSVFRKRDTHDGGRWTAGSITIGRLCIWLGIAWGPKR